MRKRADKNKKTVLDKNQKTDDRKVIRNMAKAVIKIVNEENKKYIQNWIDSEFEKKLTECVEKFVETEFKEEILPVLIQHINTKMNNLRSVTKGQVKECIKEVLIDSLNRLQAEEDGN